MIGLLQRLDANNSKVNALQCSLADMRRAAASQAADVDEQERRRPNLIVTMIGAKSQADADAFVPILLNTLDLACTSAAVCLLSSTSYVDAARAAAGPHRGGSGAGLVLVKVADVQDKISIYNSANKLQGIPVSHSRLDDALTPTQTQIRRSREAPHFQKLWNDQQRPRWRGAEIIGAGRIWRPSYAPKRLTSLSFVTACPPVQPSVTTTLTTPLQTALETKDLASSRFCLWTFSLQPTLKVHDQQPESDRHHSLHAIKYDGSTRLHRTCIHLHNVYCLNPQMDLVKCSHPPCSITYQA